MPVYVFECPKCKTMLEKRFKIAEMPDSVVSDCCICDKKDVEFKRILTPSSFRIRGDGVYKPTSKLD